MVNSVSDGSMATGIWSCYAVLPWLPMLNDAKPDVADVPPGSDKTIAAILGEIVWLMSQSSEFKQYLISDLEWLVMPPILLRQFRLFYHEGRPVAVVLYARVSSEVEARLEAGAPTLRPEDWKSGSRVRVVRTISLIAGGQFEKEALRALDQLS